MKRILFLATMTLALVACNSKSGDNDKKTATPAKPQPAETGTQSTEAFERTHLAGQIDGQAWTQISGRVTAPNEEGLSYLTLWGVDIANPCDPVEVGPRAIVAKIALKAARIELNEEKTITLSVYDGEMARSTEMKSGVLKIQKVQDGVLRGALKASLDEQNSLEGAFQVEVCQ